MEFQPIELDEILTRLEKQIQELTEQNQLLQIRNEKLTKERNELQKLLIEKENECRNMVISNNIGKLAVRLDSHSDTEALKQQIDAYINDIDACLQWIGE